MATIVPGTGGMTEAQYRAEIQRKLASQATSTSIPFTNEAAARTFAPELFKTAPTAPAVTTAPAAPGRTALPITAPNTPVTRPTTTGAVATATPTYWDQYGGKDAYAQSQKDRYVKAVQSGDQALISSLQADAARVGYTLPP